jgi:GNAT superfamily N-acetyltransferase
MELVALYPPETVQYEIVGLGQWVLDTEDNIPEIVFQIRDDWQGQGLGIFFFKRLIEMAKKCAKSDKLRRTYLQIINQCIRYLKKRTCHLNAQTLLVFPPTDLI